MGLFGLGKKKEEVKSNTQSMSHNLDELPKMPEFPPMPDEEVADFPSYEPTLADIKNEIGKSSDEDYEVPIRVKPLSGKSMLGVNLGVEHSVPMEDLHLNSQKQFNQDKPLFVKIDTYKEAMQTLDALKAKLGDAEEILKSLEYLKSQEDEKLEAWKKDVNNIKEKLLSIDRDLFEV